MQDIVRAVRRPSLSAAMFLTALAFTFSARSHAQDRRQPDVAAPVVEEPIELEADDVDDDDEELESLPSVESAEIVARLL